MAGGVLTVSTCSKTPPAAPPSATADTIYSGGDIITVNDAAPAAEALAVKDGKILAAGKLADFAVLEQDPFTVPKEKIRDIKVWGTVVGGRVFPARAIRP